ncbi:MAG: hydratase [Thiotrichales bacterium]|nr:hydratase [Thiotrichales bacterium]
MPAESNTEALAELLARVRAEQRTLKELPSSLRPTTTEDGYRAQTALMHTLGESPRGWKIACTNDAAQSLMQTHEPFAGPLFESMLHASPATLDGREFNMRMIEGEFAFRLGSDLPARAEGYSREEVEAAIDSVCPAIEIADSRFNDWLGVGLPSLIADGAVSGAFVHGPEYADWRSLDLCSHPVIMRANDEVVGEGSGALALGDPVASLTWLANKQCELGRGLSNGEIVTTGTCTGNYQAPGIIEVSADFGVLGRVEVRFA